MQMKHKDTQKLYLIQGIIDFNIQSAFFYLMSAQNIL